jgi:aspartokinase
VAQGSSEYNISLVVEQADTQAAVRAIHEEFEL